MSERRKIWLFAVVLIAGLLSICIFLALKPAKVYINRGSCLGAITAAQKCLRTYRDNYGVLPFSKYGAVEALRKAGLGEDDLRLVAYINDAKLTPTSAPRTIIICCLRPVTMPNNVAGKYVGLLSGEITLLPESM